MQILSIRGANLASLADRFEIDLTSEPLASAGLFAITGETGAGKSTILDAMCLALYGNCPRLSGAGVNDDVPDIAGEVIKSSDPRAIMRRGASHAHAEVDFLAPDGLCYRASWTARRARGRPEGRLQNVDRALVRLDDGTVLESQINAVRDRVTQITGLTYDEFRRTVLLAQGDFDAFLRANTAERAALLEKVTGTEIYREISKRIYARHEDAKAALAELEVRRAATPALTDEERQAMTEEQEGLTREIAGLLTEIKALTKDISAFEAHAAANTALASAQATLAMAVEEQGKAKADRALLSEIDAALNLRSEGNRCDAARAAVDRLAAEAARLSQAERDKKAEVECARMAADAARAAARTAEEVFKSFGPQWTEATRLDGLLRESEKEVRSARMRLDTAIGKQSVARKNLKSLTDAETIARNKHDAAVTQLGCLSGAERLADRWDELSTLMKERTDQKAIAAKAEADLARAQRDEAEGAGQQARLTELDAKDRTRIAELESGISELETRLADLMKDDPRKRLERLSLGQQYISEMERLSRVAGQAEDAARAARAEIAAQRKLADEARIAQNRAEREAARAEAAIQALQEPVDQAEAAASDIAAHLRRSLAPGRPCPVCGSKDHPVSEDAALSRIAREMRSRLEAERIALGQAQKNKAAADRALDAAELAARTQSGILEAAQEQLMEARNGFSDNRAQAAEMGLTGLPEDALGAGDALKVLEARLSDRRREIEGLIGQVEDLSNAITRDRKILAETRKALDGREAERETLRTRVAEAQRKVSLAEQEIRQAGSRIAQIDGVLEAPLAGVSVTPADLDENPDSVRNRLSKLVETWRQEVGRRDAAERELRELATKISSAQANLSGVDEEVGSCRADLETRSAAHEELARQRAALLDGEETEAHRSRHNARRLETQEARERAAAELSQRTSEHSALLARIEAVAEAAGPAQAELEEAEADLMNKLAGVGMGRDRLKELLAMGSDRSDSLRAHLKKIDDAVVAARSAASARAADLERLVAAGLPEGEEQEFRGRLAAAEEARDGKRERMGAIAGQLSADNAVRETLKGLDAEIAAAREVRDTWAAVNEAVGSRQGGKFAQIAQGVTLSLLVERANLHLADLKPRYSLARGGEDLSLHIIDRDMGDEIRSTRSLSGGERFLVSLALALALSGMGGQGGLAATLFIDEGFGSLDSESLDLAMDALESLQAQGRKIGVISHVEAMKDRIPVQIRVTRHGAGASSVTFAAA